MCAPSSTVALYPAWSSKRTAAAWTTGPSWADEPDREGGERPESAGGMIMVSGVRCLAAGRLAGLLGGLPGHLRVFGGRGRPGRRTRRPATRSTAPPTRLEQTISTGMSPRTPCARCSASIQPLPRKVANGGRSARPSPARVKITPVTRKRPAAAVQPGLVDRAEPVQHDPGAQEQGGLDQPVADDVDGGAGQAERGQQRDADQEHAGVADRGERQQPLDVPLAEAEQRPGHGGQQAEGQEDVADGGPVRRAPGRTSTSRPGRSRTARARP